MRRNQTVWVCRKTGSRFLERKDFAEHLLALRTRLSYDRRRAQAIDAGLAFAKGCGSITELENWLNNSDFFLRFARLHDPAARSTLGKFKFERISAGDCRNSHSAPRGLPTNWGGGNEGIPRHYPGISCDIRFSGKIISKSCIGERGTDYLEEIGICTGTGGGGGESYRYECTIWAQEFPKLFDNLLVKQIANELGINSNRIETEHHEA